MQGELDAAVAHLARWLREAAWPSWLEHGVDRARGGFFEALDLRTLTCAAPFRRLRVVARQIYVFSHAHQAGVAGADVAVDLGLHFLERHAAHGDGGYAWRFDLQHRPIDRTRDLYDHAFILLALASAKAAAPAEMLRRKALDLMVWLNRAFRLEDGGYRESLPPALPRRQNPHMHLLEAVLAAHRAFGEPIFMTTAAELIDLFARRLFDPASGALPEFFDESLHPVQQGGAFLVEPGHHCEWVWLLHDAQRVLPDCPDLAGISDRLMAFVDRFGIGASPFGLVNLVDSTGAQVDGGYRLWPQTERLKAELLRADADPARQLAALRTLQAHLRPDGLWHERRGADGVLSEEPAPASSLYHLTSAILVAEAAIKAGRPSLS
jgi:mannose-6-phosphate isomerase